MKAKGRILFILFAFFLLSSSYAAEGFFKKKYTQESFQRNVRPMARTILNQFYDLLEKVSPEQAPLIQVKRHITETQLRLFSWQRTNDELNPEKISGLEEIYEHLRKVERLILDIQRQGLKLKKGSKSHEIDSRIDLADTLDEMSNQCFALLNIIENILINSNSPTAKQRLSLLELNSQLNYMRIDAERSFLGGLSDELQPHFDFVWTQFFKDLELHVVMEGRSSYFETAIEEFNINWNVFYSKMTTENFSSPKEMRPYLDSIHQNWKMILRSIIN